MLALLFLLLSACDPETRDAPSWHGEVQPIVAHRCVSCHEEGGIAPYRLETYEDAQGIAPLIADSVASGRMPPWAPDPECNAYRHDRGLEPGEEAAILAWAEGGAPEGGPVAPATIEPPAPLDADLTLELPEPYTPRNAPDDYRCLLVDWPEEEPGYVTGFEVVPDRQDQVHHVIAFVVDEGGAQAFRDADGADGDPGYPCFGDPAPPGMGLTDVAGGMRWLATWTPGPSSGERFPEGTGIEVTPGSVVVVQMHYYAPSDPEPDQTSLRFALAEEVERPAGVMPFTDPAWLFAGGMDIPAGESSVTHGFSSTVSDTFLSYMRGQGIPLEQGEPFQVHMVGLHMHYIGQSARLDIVRDEERACQLHIPDWDFHWQESYHLAEPTIVYPGDRIELECTWDNSEGTQDVSWGDGTDDEMCLGMLYVSPL